MLEAIRIKELYIIGQGGHRGGGGGGTGKTLSFSGIDSMQKENEEEMEKEEGEESKKVEQERLVGAMLQEMRNELAGGDGSDVISLRNARLAADKVVRGSRVGRVVGLLGL